ncbi:MAG: radical SAM protein, partial [Acidobacteriota bacterium]
SRTGGEMPFPLFERICDQLEGGSIAREIHFHVMGEPFLYRRLADAVALAASKGLTTVVTTNGSLLTRERVEELLRARLSRLVVSLQTPDARSFEIRGARDLTFERYEDGLLAGIRHALSRDAPTRVVLGFRTTAFPKVQSPGQGHRILGTNEELREAMLSFARRALPRPPEGVERDRIEGLVAQATVTRWNVVHVNQRFALESRPLGGWVKPRSGARFHPATFGTCHALSEMFAILAGGEMTFCCMDEEGETSVGNARTMALADFFRHPEVLRVHRAFQRMRVVHPRCRVCLGEPGVILSLGHQVGSIFYEKVYRKHFKREIGAPPA